MSHDQSRNQHSDRIATGQHANRNWLESILFAIIGLMIFILVYQVVTHRGGSHAIKFGSIKTDSEQTKLLFKTR